MSYFKVYVYENKESKRFDSREEALEWVASATVTLMSDLTFDLSEVTETSERLQCSRATGEIGEAE